MNAPVRTSPKVVIGTVDPKVSKSAERAFLTEHAIPVLIGLIIVTATTAIMMAFSDYFVKDHLIFIYLLPIAGIAMYFGSTPALVMSFISVIGTAYFLFPPKFSFLIEGRLQIAELLFFFIFAFTACKASSHLSR